MQKDHYEISKSDIKFLEWTGRFSMTFTRNGSELVSRYAEIAPVTGNMGSSNMGNMLQTPSVIGGDYAVSYGFADTGMNKCDQAYMNVTDNHSNWMGDLMNAKPELKNKLFQAFALPGSHDAGMFTGINSGDEARNLVNALIRKYSTAENLAMALAAAFGVTVVSPELLILAGVLLALVESSPDMIRRALINLAYTQKDDIKTQLLLGVRYFDFRPGYNADFYKSDNKLRHQHLFIPGYEFDRFLADTIEFLKTHRQEIVVININFNGFFEDSMKPSQSIIDTYIANDLSGSGIVRGGPDDLSQTTGSLLAANKRLIILEDKSNYFHDSYSDKDYATDNPNSVIKALNEAIQAPKASTIKGTVLQLQATYTNMLMQHKADLISALLTFSDATSPLLYTKARFDNATYPWVAQNVNASNAGIGLAVLLNDFADNALVSHSIAATRQRSDAKK